MPRSLDEINAAIERNKKEAEELAREKANVCPHAFVVIIDSRGKTIVRSNSEVTVKDNGYEIFWVGGGNLPVEVGVTRGEVSIFAERCTAGYAADDSFRVFIAETLEEAERAS